MRKEFIKMKKFNNFLKENKNAIIAICLTIIMIILLITFGFEFSRSTQSQQQEYVTYNVIAAADETYILQECNDKEHYIEVDQSEMYSIGDTVLVSYSNNEITSIWLYVDC